jgi:two-component system NtrC family sensor kinase
LLIGSVVVPLLMAGVAGYYSYHATYERAAAALAEAAKVAEENTTKILDTHLLAAGRIDDLLEGLSDPEILAREKSLHDRMAKQIENVPQIAAAWVIGANGRALVSARVFPVDRELDHSGREDFRTLQEPGMQTFIWALRARSLETGEFQPYFTVSRRREGPDARFAGITVVAVSGDYFGSFYQGLLGGSAEYVASVLREDGTLLARYPETGAMAAPGQQDELIRAIAKHIRGGMIASGSPFDAPGTVVAYKRLASYPVYVAIGRTKASILREWLESTIGYAMIAVPAVLGFILLNLLALRRTQREQTALAQARDAIAQRAALEAQLHQAQKVEAVALLTAGIAHDFNNLLTIAAGNIALLQQQLDNPSPRQQKFIASANSACERAAVLIRRLLSFARREPVDPQPTDANQIISDLSDLPWRTLGDRIELTLRLAPDLWPVFIDPFELENALVNLAINARDAMAGVGRLTVETLNCKFHDAPPDAPPGTAGGDYVLIAVSDTGCGMTPEVRDKVFDPYHPSVFCDGRLTG